MATDLKFEQVPALAYAADFAADSRVWVYVLSRSLRPEEVQWAQTQLDQFVVRWTAHNQALKARAEVFAQRLILLMVDEHLAGASGCSIDKSVHFLEQLGEELGVDCFDRMCFGWVNGDQLEFVNSHTMQSAYQAGTLTDERIMLNTLVQTKQDLQEKWLVPLGLSWHKRLVANYSFP